MLRSLSTNGTGHCKCFWADHLSTWGEPVVARRRILRKIFTVDQDCSTERNLPFAQLWSAQSEHCITKDWSAVHGDQLMISSALTCGSCNSPLARHCPALIEYHTMRTISALKKASPPYPCTISGQLAVPEAVNFFSFDQSSWLTQEMSRNWKKFPSFRAEPAKLPTKSSTQARVKSSLCSQNCGCWVFLDMSRLCLEWNQMRASTSRRWSYQTLVSVPISTIWTLAFLTAGDGKYFIHASYHVDTLLQMCLSFQHTSSNVLIMSTHLFRGAHHVNTPLQRCSSC